MPFRRLPLAVPSGLITLTFLLVFAFDAVAAGRLPPWPELGGVRDTLSETKFGKWLTVLRQESESRARAKEACDDPSGADCEPALWSRLMRSLTGRGAGAQLDLVNRAFNQLPYRSDRSNWGRIDHWATPKEFLERGGDCEDFAIAKYFALRDLGFPPEQLRVVILRNTRANNDHAVLVVHLDGRDLVLDVLQRFVVPWSAVGHYRPFYSVNETEAWLHL